MREPTTERRRRTRVFAITALGAFMASLDLSIVNIAFPALQHSFSHDSRAVLAWVITAYTIVFASLLVIAGRTADRIGRRRVFFAGLAVFSLGSGLCGLAPTVALLIAGRVIQGAGAAAMVPSSLGLLLGAFPVERRSQIVALWGGVGALAVATGPSLGAALISAGGWRWVFFVNLPVGLVAWLGGRRVLVETREATSQVSPDYAGVVLLVGALAALVLAISEGSAWGWGSGRVVAGFVLAPVVGALFLYRSARHPEPVLDLSLFTARSFSVANAAALIYAMGFFAMLLGNVLFLTSVWHYSILEAGRASRVPGGARRRIGRVRRRPRLVCHPHRTPPGIRGPVAAGHTADRLWDRPHLPRTECGGRVELARPPFRGRQRRQPDRPPDRRLARDRPTGRHPRDTDDRQRGSHRLSSPVALRRDDGGAIGSGLHPPRGTSACIRGRPRFAPRRGHRAGRGRGRLTG